MAAWATAAEVFVEYIRAKRATRYALVISDPHPVGSIGGLWSSAGQAANIGIFLLLLGGFLYVGRGILLPILIAAVVSLTLAPLIRAGKNHGVSPWITAIVIVVLAIGALALAAMALAGPVGEWIGRAPEIGATIKQKLVVLQAPLAALRRLQTDLFGSEAAAPAHRQRCREEPRRLSGARHRHQCRGRHHHRTRRLADRAARSGDVRPDCGGAELHSLCRAGGCRAGAVRRRPGQFSLARPCTYRAVRLYRADHARGPFHHARHRRPEHHAQSAHGGVGARILDLDVGSDRRLSGHAVVDYRPRGVQPPLPTRRSQTSRMMELFAPLRAYLGNSSSFRHGV